MKTQYRHATAVAVVAEESAAKAEAEVKRLEEEQAKEQKEPIELFHPPLQMASSSFWSFKMTLQVLLFVSVMYLLFQPWLLLIVDLFTISFLLTTNSLVAVIFRICRHFYYCRHGTLVDATILESTLDKKQKDEDRTIGGTLVELLIHVRWEQKTALVEYEYEATTVDVVSRPGKEEETRTSYRTIRVQKWLSIPLAIFGRSNPSSSWRVMVLPGRPRSAILQEQLLCPRMLGYFLLGILVYALLWACTRFQFLFPVNLLRSMEGDNGCNDFGKICLCSWDCQLAYYSTAVIASLLEAISTVWEPSVVTVAGQELEDMAFNSDTLDSDWRDSQTSIII